MDRTIFFNGQRVTADDLNAIDIAKATALKQALSLFLTKFSHAYSGSIPVDFRQSVLDATVNPVTYRGVGGGLGSDYLQPLQSSASQIAVSPGWGVTDNMDILIIPESVLVNKDDDTLNATWISTPNVPMYVIAEYQETSGSIGVTPTGDTVYTRYTGAYRIRVTSAYPDGGSQIPLAQFTADVSGLITSGSLSDVREYIRTYTVDTSVGLTPPALFTGQSTLYDHVHAIGTGTPSSTNPHGETLADLGYVDSTGAHRTDSHVSGLVVMNTNYDGDSYRGTLHTGGADEYISFASAAGVELVVNGLVVTGSIPLPLYASSANLGVGDYWVVANSLLQASFVGTTVGSLAPFDPLYPQTSSQYVLLGRANNVNASSQTIGSFTDMRTFYAMSQPVIRADFVESGSAPGVALSQSSTLQDNLNRIRHQIGMALTGDGTAWNGAHPLTAGSGSVADAYHKHTNSHQHTVGSLGASFDGGGAAADPTAAATQNNSGSIIEVCIPIRVDTIVSDGSAAAGYLHIGASSTKASNPVVSQHMLTIAASAGSAGTLRGLVAPGEYWGVTQATVAALVTWGVPRFRIFSEYTGVTG